MTQEENYIELENSYFFDSYAFFEIIRENKNYLPYLSAGIVTTKLNLFELYHGFLKGKDDELAKISLEKYYQFAVDFNGKAIEEAAKLKIALNKRDLSIADCVGYALAKQLGIKFLTGDEQFKDMENVEFVK